MDDGNGVKTLSLSRTGMQSPFKGSYVGWACQLRKIGACPREPIGRVVARGFRVPLNPSEGHRDRTLLKEPYCELNEVTVSA